MNEDRSLPILPGDTWNLTFAGICRHAKVMEQARPGWWRCVDTETGVSFLANERWFVDRIPDERDMTDDA